MAAREIIAALGGNQSTGMCRCPAHDDRTPSLHVSDGSKGVVLVHCHAGCPPHAVIAELKQRGLWPTKRHRVRLGPTTGSIASDTEQIARQLITAAQESSDAPTRYLRRRGLKRAPPTLKLIDRGTTGAITGVMLPAMVAPVTSSDGRSVAAHVTYVTADAKENAVGNDGKKHRRMFGEVGGGLVILQPADPERPLIVGEGIETVLSAMQVTGLPGAAALSASNLPKIEPPKCSEVIIAADADGAGMEAAEKLAARLAAAGRKVRIAAPPTPGNDWNDELKARDDTNEMSRQIVEAPPYTSAAADGPAEFLAPVKPWDEPVDGAALLDDLVDVFNRHMVLPRGAADGLALWVIHSHAHDAARHSPILFISSPTKRCGKTNLLSVLHLLTPKPVPAANVTPAVIFRAVDVWKPTLLIDEADTFIADKSELRGVLNSGHTRSQAYVLRCVGEDMKPKRFSTWAPKAFAAIGRLHPTLEDRSIRIELTRKRTTDTVERVPARDGAYEELRRKVARWVADNHQSLQEADPDVPDELSDRARDNWTPLLAIADRAGGSWPDRARTAARQLSSGGDEEGQPEMLLKDMRAIFDRKGADALLTETIIASLIGLEDRPWAEFKGGRPITANALARLLKPFQVSPRKMRLDGAHQKRSAYERRRLEPVWNRYLDGDEARPTGPTGQTQQKHRVRRHRNRARS